jgi:hypothetical protein
MRLGLANQVLVNAFELIKTRMLGLQEALNIAFYKSQCRILQPQECLRAVKKQTGRTESVFRRPKPQG